MNTLITIVVLCSLATISLAKPLTPEELQNMFMEKVMSCKAEVGASDADLGTVQQHIIPTTPEGKCLHGCIMEEMGMIQGNKLSIESSIEMSKLKPGSTPEMVAVAKAIAEECAPVAIGSDRCETAVKIMECSMAAAAKLGVNPADVM